MFSLLKNIVANRFAIRSQMYVNIKTTVATTRLGMLWWLIDPFLLMFIYYFVVKVVFNRGGENYHLFALCGIVTWQSFARSINLSTGALVRNASLIKQVPFPMVLYVLISPLVQAFFYGIGLGSIMVWNYQEIGLHTLALVVPIVLLALLSFTIGIFLSIFEVFVRDTGKMVTYILRFGFYLSPVLYSPSRIYDIPSITPFAKLIYSLNPMVYIIGSTRSLLVDGQMFDWQPMVYISICVLVSMQIGIFFFNKVSPSVPKRL